MIQESSIVVEAQHVHKQVPIGTSSLVILEDINLTISVGQTVAIVGSSGSGKTTLLSILSGLDLPSSGSVTVDGQVISQMNEDQRAKVRNKKIGIIFQTFQLIPSLTALENVLMPLELSGHQDAIECAHTSLSRVGLSARLDHYPEQLSGGEQQRVAIARAFAFSPRILFADEPTGNLDRKTGKTIIDQLLELNSHHHSTLVIVTHDPDLASICQSKYTLEEGSLV